jgi:hypothetical protein
MGIHMKKVDAEAEYLGRSTQAEFPDIPPLRWEHRSAMNGLTIYVDWQYFLGILGALIGLAYYANGRFTKIETTVEWLKEILLEIKKQLDNDRA